jgi:hypothetical protein
MHGYNANVINFILVQMCAPAYFIGEVVIGENSWSYQLLRSVSMANKTQTGFQDLTQIKPSFNFILFF